MKTNIIMPIDVMFRTSLMIEEAIKDRAEEAARAAGVSFGEFVRRAIENELGRQASKGAAARRSSDPLFAGFEDLVAKAKPGPADGALNHDAFLYGS